MSGKHSNKKNRIIETVLSLLILLALGVFFGRSDVLSYFGSGQETPPAVESVSQIVPFVASSAVPAAEPSAVPTVETSEAPETTAPSVAPSAVKKSEVPAVTYAFRNSRLLNEHYEKHGMDMGFADAASYEQAASAVVTNPNALHKIEKEDGDDVYYVEATNEFVIVSGDGYIRTYFCPDSGIKYYNKQ